MDDISRKLKAFDWKGLQKQAKKVQASTASALKDLVMTDLENKVRAATGDTNWGASGADLAEIAQGTYNREDFTLIMSILWQRLASTRWRCVYKALDVLRYLVLHGSSRVLEETRDALPHIRRLEHYSFVDQSTRRDEGANVRARASAFVAILADDRLLEEERTKSAALRAKIGIAVPSSHYTSSAGAGGGLSSDDYRFGAASHSTGPVDHGAYDAPPQRSLGTAAAAEFDGFGAQPQHTAPQATVDDLLGGPVPALPAPDSTPAVSAAPGLADLLADTPSVTTNGNGNHTNGVSTHPAPSLFDIPANSTANADASDSDDDFDPRAFGSAPAPTPASATGPIPTSRLVQNLAAARASAAEEQARTEAAVTPLSAMQAAVAAVENKAPINTSNPYDGLVNFDNLMQDKSTRVESKPIASVQQPSTVSPTKNKLEIEAASNTGVEVDPFGDLLSTAKKSGVL